MDRREPPRIGPGDGAPDDEPAPRLGLPFTPGGTPAGPGRRRHSPTRLGLAIGLGLAAIVVLALVGPRLVRGLADWVHAQPEYQLPFGAIVLDPPPPPWIKSGAAGLLEQARLGEDLPETLSAPGADLHRVGHALAFHSPWIRSVERVERVHPNGIIARVRYREPVALYAWSDPASERPTVVVVDGDGVFLPRDDIVRAAAEPLIQLKAKIPPDDPTPGLYWSDPAAAGPSDRARPERPRAGARLAAFFKAKQGSDAALPAGWAIRLIDVDHPPGLVAYTGGGFSIIWGEAPGQEAIGEPPAEEKWSRLRAWTDGLVNGLERAPDPLTEYLVFTADGVQVLVRPSRRAAGKGP